MVYVPTLWKPRGDPAQTNFSAARMNNIEQGIADLYAVKYAEDLTEVTTTITGDFQEPQTGVGGPEVTFVVPAGGRFVQLNAECECKHSAVNTNGIWFVLWFSRDGGAYTVHPQAGYGSDAAYVDTTGSALVFGAAEWQADATYRPLRMGQSRSVASDGAGSPLYPSATCLWLPAGTFKVRMRYGIKGGGAGTAYFKTRRVRAQVLAQ